MTAVNLNPLDFPLYGSRLIEASAGTGKTFTIALLYVRLVLGHGGEAAFKQALTPPQILVVTFTDAATQELRDRIRARLNEAAQCFQAPDERHDPLLVNLRNGYPADQWPTCARRLQLASEWMDEAAVSTIHGWCYRMLREHAFDSGSLFTQTLETDQRELLDEVVRDYWRRQFYSVSPEFAKVVTDCFKSPIELREALTPLLSRTDAEFRQGGVSITAPAKLDALLQVTADWNAKYAALEAPARAAWAEDIVALEAVLHEARTSHSYPTKSRETLEKMLCNIAAWSQGGEACDHVFKCGQTRFKLKKGGSIARHPAFEAIDALADHKATKQDIRAQLLLHALREVQGAFEEEKLRRAQIGFDDLLNRLGRALQGPSGPRLAQTIRQQYPVALIDEFQDTDPVQYGIFDKIYCIGENLPDCGLFMIGDPKQAIYSFRGADIYTYLKAREATKGRHYTLGTNYRSTQAMVDAANHCFSFAEAHPRAAFRFAEEGKENPVPFECVDAKGRSDTLEIQGEKQKALTLWQLQTNGVINNATYLRESSEVCASAIQAWLDRSAEKPSGLRNSDGQLTALKPADIAILVRSRKEAEAIRKALARRKLASVYLSDRDSVFESEEATDLLCILRACAQPTSDRLLRAALATRSVGISWQDLEQLNQNELCWEVHVQWFRDFRALWQQQGVLPMLRRLLATFKVPARLLAEEQGERRLTNLLHLAEWLQRSAAELDGEHALIRHLAEQIEEQSEEEILRLESDSDLIKVVTVHKSKGLEYPLVMLPFACSARAVDGRSKAPPMFHEQQDEQYRLLIELAKGDPAKPAQKRADDERVGEEMRLLYVALTRARYATWICVAPQGFKTGGASIDLHKSGLGYLLAGEGTVAPERLAEVVDAFAKGCNDIAVCKAPAQTEGVHVAPARPTVSEALRPLHTLAANWWIASYSALAIADDRARMGADSPVAPEPATALEANLQEQDDEQNPPAGVGIHAFPRGAGPGTFLHGLFEWAGDEGFGNAASDEQALHDAVARRCNLRGWERWIEPLSAWLSHYLKAPLCFNGTQCTLATLSTYQVEMEFWFSSRNVNVELLDALVRQHTLGGAPRPMPAPNQLNGMFKGFIDLTFEHEGRYYVADYKSNWLGCTDSAYAAEAMAETMLDKRYDLQLCLYLLALHRQLKLRLPGYDYEQHMGGALYLFIRGHQAPTNGLHFERPSQQLIEQLDQLFMGQFAEASA